MVFEKIKESIINGDWNAGQKMYIDEIAEKYGVSRTPVIQTIKMMNAEGILFISPSGKISLPQFNIKQIIDICETRLLLENYYYILNLTRCAN